MLKKREKPKNLAKVTLLTSWKISKEDIVPRSRKGGEGFNREVGEGAYLLLKVATPRSNPQKGEPRNRKPIFRKTG